MAPGQQGLLPAKSGVLDPRELISPQGLTPFLLTGHWELRGRVSSIVGASTSTHRGCDEAAVS